MRLVLSVNGTTHDLDVPPATRLIELFRDYLGLTGTKEGCAEGECGACTVIVNGKAVDSCLVLAQQVRGAEIITVEGLANNSEFDALQESFMRHTAVQCGFCTPGMLMSAKALLMQKPDPTDDDIRTAIAGNLCRCTGYSAIVAAICDCRTRDSNQHATVDTTIP
jgi:carbon-monoxide dehydrogenase small subunit